MKAHTKRTLSSNWQQKSTTDGSGHDVDTSVGSVSRMIGKHSVEAAEAPAPELQKSSSIIRAQQAEQEQQRWRRRKPTIDAGAIINATIHFVFFAYTMVIWFGELLLLPPNEVDWCQSAQMGYPDVKRYDNPDYNNNPCYKERPWQLLYMSQMETSFARRMFSSVLMGATIGFERKASDRPAGIRTMSLVCLGACLFSMCGQLAFRSSTMGFDAARVSAAVPSGVGFLGAGLIWKGTVGEKGTPDERHEVHGLTTAAGVWLSAAVGVGVGGRLYVVSVYCVALVILVLKLGPRLYLQGDAPSYWEDDDYDDDFSSETSSSDENEYLQVFPDAEPAPAARGSSIMHDANTPTGSGIAREWSIGSLMSTAGRGLQRSSSCPSFHAASTDDYDYGTSYRDIDSSNAEPSLLDLGRGRSEGMLMSSRSIRSSISRKKRNQKQWRSLSTRKLKRRYGGVDFHN